MHRPAPRPLGRARRRHVHRGGMRLAVEGQPPDEQHDDIVRGDAEPAAQFASFPEAGAPRAGLGPGRVGIAVDTERNHRQAHRTAQAPAAPACEPVGVLREDVLDPFLRRRGRADQGVPRLRRRDQVPAQRAGDPAGGDGVGHAAQAVVALAAEAAVPGLPFESRPRQEDGADGPQGPPIERTGPNHRAPGAVEGAGQGAEILEVLRRVGERDQPVGPAVLDEALDEARSGGLPALDRRAVDSVPVGVIAERAVGSGRFLVRGHRDSGPRAVGCGGAIGLSYGISMK